MSERNPGVSAVLSFVFTGLGQIYNGDIKKGLWLMFVTSLGLVIMILGAVGLGFAIYFGLMTVKKIVFASTAMFIIGLIVVGWTGIRSIFDAYNEA